MNGKKIGLKIKGMHCISCEKRIRETVLELKGVKSAKVNYTKEKATIEFDPVETNVTNILKIIKDMGYEPGLSQEKESKGFFKRLFV